MYQHFMKRFFDIVLSTLGILVLLPVFLILAIVIKIEDPGPVFFRQKRIAKDRDGEKQFFTIYKFRTMKWGTPPDTPTHLLKNPMQYLTRVGGLLRRTSMDELPQLFNIWLGQMSIVGPRPGLWNQDDLYDKRARYGVNAVTPGLTGWAQINGRDELDLDGKAKFDGEYVQKMSFAFDSKCILLSIRRVLKCDGIVEGKTEGKRKGLKILVICQYYNPEPFRISDSCQELVKRGHQVTVVTGTPNYPMGKIYKGYEKGAKADEVLGGVKVHRCKIKPRKTGVFHRFLNYYSYPYQSQKYIRKLDGNYDVVLIHQLSPVMMAKAGIKYAKKHNKKSVLYCLDLWPESLVFGGIGRNSTLYKFFHKESAKIYQNVDRILVTSRSFSDYFAKEFGIQNVGYMPQYAEDLFHPTECRKEPNEYIDLMFAGNVGTAQGVMTVIEAAKKCKDIENLRWHIVGDGIELENLKNMSIGLPVIFHGRKPVEEMPKFYSMADAMLVTMQKDPILSLTLPGKVQSYMAAGKPVIGAIDGETQKIIAEANCGFVVGAEAADELEQVVREFIATKEKEKLGRNGREYYEKNFSREIYMDTLLRNLKE